MASHSYMLKGSGVTSSSGHRQRFQQIKSPGSASSQSSQLDQQPQQQRVSRTSVLQTSNPQSQSTTVGGGGPPRMNFMLNKQNSMVRQDDSVLMRPNTMSKPVPAQPNPQRQPVALRNVVMVQSYNRQMPQSAVATATSHGQDRGGANSDTLVNRRLKDNFMDGGDQHDCTNEEQIDEFDIVDQEEVFDECDEQTGISRHQMNIGLSRHPKNSSELFNVFNRSGGAVSDTSQHQPLMQHTSSSKALMDRHRGAMQNQQQHEERKAKDRQSYNDFLRSQSPQMHQRSREGSRSPPALGHIQKEAFFGSSFAGNGIMSSQKKEQNGFTQNTFALSSVNRMQDARNSNHSLVQAQDKGPQNFRMLEMGAHSIPDQFRADLNKVGEQTQEATSDNIESSFQQDLEEEEFSKSYIQKQEQIDSQNNVQTDQDTIIDQDDDVAEECSEEDPMINQQTQVIDGPIYRFMGEKRHEADAQLDGMSSTVQDSDIKRGTANRTPISSHSPGLSQRGIFSYNHSSQQSSTYHPAVKGTAQMKSNPNILLASQNSSLSIKNAIRGPLANKPRTNMIGGGPLGVTSKPSQQSHLMTGHSFQDSRSFSRVLKTTGPSFADAVVKPQPLEQKDGVCETVEDIQESVVFMHVPMGHPSNEDNNSCEFDAVNETPNLSGAKGRITLTKKDNKDCKKMDEDLSVSDLQMQQHIHCENQGSNTKNGFKNDFSAFHHASQQSNSKKGSDGVLIDFRHGTFRSPKGSPTLPLQPRDKDSNSGNTVSKAANSSDKKQMLSNLQQFQQSHQQNENSNMNFFEAQSDHHNSVLLRHKPPNNNNNNQMVYNSGSHNEKVIVPAHEYDNRGAAVQQQQQKQRESAGFVSPIGSRHQQSASLQQQQRLEITDSASGGQRTNAELQREYLELLQQMKQTQTHKQSMVTTLGQQPLHANNRTAKPHKISKAGTLQFFDDNVSVHSVISRAKSFKNDSNMLAHGNRRAYPKHNHNSSISELHQNQKTAGHIEKRKILRNVVSTRLTPKKSYYEIAGGDDLSDRDVSQKRRVTGGPAYHVNVQSTSGQLRQVRMSARPSGARHVTGGLDLEDAGQLTSPQGIKMGASRRKRSPAPIINDTLSAKNLSVLKSGDTKQKLRNSRTFVHEKDFDKATEQQKKYMVMDTASQKSMSKHLKNRSLINRSEPQEPANDIAARSFKQRGTAQLQALAELRERENNTVQTGQLILARQRSREGYFDPHQLATGVAKSTHDRLKTGKGTETASQRNKRDVISPHMIVSQTEETDKVTHRQHLVTHGQHLVTHDYSKATFEKNLDSVEGLTADENQYSMEDDQAHDDNQQEEDVLSHSQQSDADDDDEDAEYGTSGEDVVIPVVRRRAYKHPRPQANAKAGVQIIPIRRDSYALDEDDSEREYDDYDDEDEEQYGEELYDSEGEGEQTDQQDYYSCDDDGEEADSEGYYKEQRPDILKQHQKVSMQKPMKYSEEQHSSAEEGDERLSHYPNNNQKNDSQMRMSYYPQGQNQKRHRSPMDTRSNYSMSKQKGGQHQAASRQRHSAQKTDKESAVSGTLRQQQVFSGSKRGEQQQRFSNSRKGAPPMHPQRRRKTVRDSSRSTHDIPIDRQMKAQLNKVQQPGKRNQPHKININMTEGSNGFIQKNDTNQSLNSATAAAGGHHQQQQFTHPQQPPAHLQQPQLVQQNQGYNMMQQQSAAAAGGAMPGPQNHPQPNNFMFYSPAAVAHQNHPHHQADPNLLLQLQQQQQQQQAMVNQMAHSQGYLPNLNPLSQQQQPPFGNNQQQLYGGAHGPSSHQQLLQQSQLLQQQQMNQGQQQPSGLNLISQQVVQNSSSIQQQLQSTPRDQTQPQHPQKLELAGSSHEVSQIYSDKNQNKSMALHHPLEEDSAENNNGISWLQSSQAQPQLQQEEEQEEEDSKKQMMSGEPQALAAAEPDEDDLEDLWKKLREQEAAKADKKEAKLSMWGDNKPRQKEPIDTNITVERTQQQTPPEEQEEEDQLENFMVTKKPKKAEAIIIGFDDSTQGLPARNPFANRAKRPPLSAATSSKDGKQSKPRGSIKSTTGARAGNRVEGTDEAPVEKVVPLGTDFKKISIEQIQAREERLKKIKDQGLIEITIDDGQSAAPNENLAEAFLAKRRARMGLPQQKQPLDQDLAVARDASSTPVDKSVQAKPKVQKTPQELAEIRKAMKKKRHQPTKVNESLVQTPDEASRPSMLSKVVGSEATMVSSAAAVMATPRTKSSTSKLAAPSSTKEPSTALMERLAGGKRTTIDKKEMKKLTKSKFENLPEIKRRKDEERKKQEALEKKERIAKYNKECKARSRAQLKKKREAAATSSMNVTVTAEAGNNGRQSRAAGEGGVATAQISLAVNSTSTSAATL